MTYDLALVGDPDRNTLAAALAELAARPVAEVDVSDMVDTANRNWDAAVSCVRERMRGDLRWRLDIYFAEQVVARPAEAEVAAVLAERLGMPVLYAAEEPLPSAYWLAAPGGVRTRARVYERVDGEAGGTIDAVAAPVPGLPGVRVDRLPEVIREYPLARPVTAEFAAATTDASDPAAVWFARTRLGAWEGLAARMASDWPPDGWYPIDFYREDLETRDELAAVAGRLPAAAAARFTAALARVDEAFRAVTVETDDEYAAALFPVGPTERTARGWWWRRRPARVPWSAADRG